MAQGEGGGRPRKFKTAAEVEEILKKYQQRILGSIERIPNAKTGIPSFVQDAPYYKEFLHEIDPAWTYQCAVPYENGDYDTADNKFSEVFTRAREWCEIQIVKAAARGAIPERLANSILEKFNGYAQKHEITALMSQNAGLNDQEIEAKLKRLLAKHQNSEA